MQYAQGPPRTQLPAPRKRGPPTALRIDTPVQNPHIALALSENPASTSTLSPTTSESDFPFHNRPPRSLRNMKKLSLTLPSAQSSTNSLLVTPPEAPVSATSTHPEEAAIVGRPRRPSVISLPNPSINPLLHRKEEDGGGSPSVPYADGPLQIIPGIWLGSEDNARDWNGLMERGIKAILNVAKEVITVFDSAAPQPRRRFASTPNLATTATDAASTFYPAHRASGRPGMHYMKLQWSHGQQDLVDQGFPAAISFVDAALQREEGVLIHCQCGISRSATMVIALVMRAAATASPSVPPEIWALKGMQQAYAYVKEKSKWVGPNMSLIYQLLEYERKLKGASSPASSDRSSGLAEEEEEWGRRRQMLDESSSDTNTDDDDRESIEVMQEARALDKAMEDRILARKSSGSSISSSSGVGMGPAWRNRYGGSRKRAGSVASNLTNGSILSEELVEEEEEQELLGVGGGFDGTSEGRRSSWELDESSSTDSSGDKDQVLERSTPFTPLTARPLRTPRPPPSAPVFRTSFGSVGQVPATATKSSFDLPPIPPSKAKRRPPPLGILPPVPASPLQAVNAPPRPPRARTLSRKPAPPPLHLRSTENLLLPPSTSTSTKSHSVAATPSQTLFVFPPSPTLSTRTPSTMTLTSNVGRVPFPVAVGTPRVTTFGRPRSYIALGVPPTPTTACSRVDARGWIGQE
ncbi:hypothetical protein PLICRDRAFT_100232 [Plicaturopsis crispa FD-325 SS-3]|nr:hypothetical protein PLICRDRAFT_100232 [Plicaturopsis crispa FD-325 SS-3]